MGPPLAILGPMVPIGFKRVEALELLGTPLAYLNDAESRAGLSARVLVFMTVRDARALTLREES